MKRKTRVAGFAGLILICNGCVLGLIMILAGVKGSIETMHAINNFKPDLRLHTLACPVLLDVGETGTIRAAVRNSKGNIQRYHFRIEAPAFTITGERPMFAETIPAGTVVTYTWTIQPKAIENMGIDIVKGELITVRAVLVEDFLANLSSSGAPYPAPPSPYTWSGSYTESCGVGVIHFPGVTVGQVLWISGLSVLLGFGFISWWGKAKWAAWRESDQTVSAE